MASLPEEPIAIIGSACRFPGGCSSPSKLWELLREPRDVRKQFDPKRLNLERFHNADGQTHGSTDVRGLSYLLEEDTRVFDAGFFGISPVVASGMDPQQRLLLEVSYEACESAGVTLDRLRGSQTSVHVGSMSNDYGVIQARDPETMPKYNATGAHAPSIIANRVSYVLDLKGPSVTIDTACSSSLVALHQAVQGLRAGDCDAAIVGGTNLIMDPGPYIAESKLQMLSPDSQCRMWDVSANGYGRGEGVAALLLKPLAKALADGDPVQGVVRATGVNSDGQSPGITMPFAPAQTDLIRRTYRRAGLDPLREADRPQYFECHGTGTQAGDPVEARAVYDVFFRGQDQQPEQSEKIKPETLIVGSIKTIIGHTEGCAGLAGVIKVLLMLKYQTVPPNMLFNQLNPKIAPFYGPGALEIATKAMTWPARPAGTPMRASVNSFGFGGTNAHAIIEALPEVAEEKGQKQQLSDGAIGPLLFSAQSGPALLRNVQAYLDYAETHVDSLDLRDLSRILQTHRSAHRVRTFFTGATREDVLDAMARFVTSHAGKAKSGDIGSVPRLINPAEAPGILGVFTGQGAQWATMGRGLMAASPVFRRSLEACDAILQQGLLKGHGHAPTWSLIEELCKDADTSRLGEAELAQPLCTALQIAQVDIITASGIRLDAVVGHSSGEIAATYAAGLISRKAAMQIAYYRGFYAHLARAGTKVGGGMLAVGLSLSEASELCRQPVFVGRLVVAASNAPQSCTLSGDRDAVAEAKEQLERDNIFARPLLVDTAYHSHHMAACADAYLQALLACDISVNPGKGRGRGACVWSSSVRGDARLVRRGGEAELFAALKGPYWVANMVQMVKFSQALESALWHGGPFDLAIELGPHPALKGPVEQTLKAAYGATPPYASLLKRKTSDVAVAQETIGSVWSQLGPAHVDFDGFRGIWGESNESITTPKSLLAELPGYAWDHDRVYWRESRISARYRTLADTAHELLGRRMPDDNDSELRWRNVLRLREIPWLKGHEVLREVLLPGAAYVSIAAQAAQYVAGSRPVASLAVEDVDILRPVVVPDNTDGVETIFTVQVLPTADGYSSKSKAAQVVRAKFAYYVCPNEVTGAMMHTCSGNLVIHLGPVDSGNGPTSTSGPVLPGREPIPDNAVHVDGEAIHEMFGQIGLDYHDAFAAMKSCERALGYAAATAVWPADSDVDTDADAASLGPSSGSYVLHPVILDVAFQALFVAHAHPASLMLKRAMLPSHIDRVLIDPNVSVTTTGATASSTTCHMDAWVTDSTGATLDGDISLYVNGEASTRVFAQVEGLRTRAAGGLDASQDRHIFCRTTHGCDISVMGLTLPPRDPIQDERTLRVNEATERLTLWYIRQVVAQVKLPPPPSSDKTEGESETDSLQWHHRRMLEAFAHHLDLVRQGKHPLVQTAWLTDGPVEIAALDREHGDTVEFRLMHAVGGALARVVQGESHLLLQVMQQDDLLNQFYMRNNTSVATNRAVGQLMKQIAFKFPRCNMLEIGAGTGGTTWSVLHAVDDLYDSYTFTDVSPAFFAAAAEKFAAFDRVAYRTLDIEQDVAAQGFAPHSYDVVIAANVLHATKSLADTLARARNLLRPGGYLVLLETTGTQSMVGFLFGGLPGWWQSTEPSRRYGPTVPTLEWHRLLCRAGFSGADTVLHDSPDESRHVTSCIVSQAVDKDVLRLRSPLDFVAPADLPTPPSSPLLLIGGKRLVTTRVVDEITRLLPKGWRSRLRTIPSIDDIDLDDVSLNRADVLCLHDADEPLFATLPMSEPRLRRLQHLFLSASSLLWVTAAGTTAPLRASMIRGITRVVPKEIPHLSVQVLGLEDGAGPAVDARRCVEALLRLRHVADIRETEGQTTLPLWSIEPECEVLVDGEVRIPRVMPATALNERFAARNRPVVKTVDATDIAVQAVANRNGKMELRQFLDHSQGAVQMDVEYALHVSSHRDGSSAYIVHGRVNDNWAMALSSANVSRLFLQPGDVFQVGSSCYTPASIKTTADALLCRALVHRVAARALNADSTVVLVLFEPQLEMAKKIETELKAELRSVSVEVYCVTSTSDVGKIPVGWIRVHTNMSRRMAKQCLPSNRVDFFVDCSETSEDSTNHSREHLKASLLPTCQIFAFDGELLRGFLPQQSAIKAESQSQTIEALFKSVDVAANSTDGICSKSTPTIMAADLAGMNASTLSREQYLCSWHRQQSLPLTIQPPETDIHSKGLLRPDRTYLIMGGSGGLGLSLTRWMIRHGARNIVITSRRAQTNAGLQVEARRAGAAVHTLAVDVTQRAEVETAVATIRATMPPIAGVCNLSMVLHDAVFLDMSPRQLNETLAAKVVGTENLDAVFNEGAEELDFFIVTSSAASTIGNVAQANYHAGNLFMDAVVAGRRARGLAASVVHIGWVADTGYITRFEKEKQLADHFRSIRLTPLSETDVQDAFAMAVRASRVDSSDTGTGTSNDLEHDITMGLAPPTAPMQAGQVNKAVWTSDPRLMALKPYTALSANSQQQQNNSHGDGRSSGSAGVREQVAQAETEDDAIAAVAAAFGAKLETMLQLPKGAVHESNGLERPIVDLGIDSLVAVEIRTWFLKELDTEVPIVKILGGETVLEVSAKAAKKMLADRKEVSPKVDEKKEVKEVEKVIQAPKELVKQTPTAALSPDVVTPIPVDSSLVSTENSSSSSSIVEHSESGSDSPKTATTDDEEEKGEEEHQGQAKKIDPVIRPDPVIVREAPMSAAQCRFWFVHKHSDNPAACNNAFYYRLRGRRRVNTARLRHALRVVAAHHECLRTCYFPRLEDGHPMQGIMAPSESTVRLTHTEYDGRDSIETALRETLAGFKTRAWDLEHGETMEISLLGLKGNEGEFGEGEEEAEGYGFLVLGYHHITLDGWSVALFWKDVDRAYRMQPLTPVDRGLSYVDYSLHQLSEEETGALDEDLAFWRAEFASSLPDTLPLLPMARGLDRSSLVRQQKQPSSAHNLDQELNPAQLEAVKSLSQRLRISPFHVHLALLQVLLARLTGTEDICIGVVDANRRDERFVNTLGCFVNMVPLRATVAASGTASSGTTSSGPDFASIARAASRKAMSVFAHGTLPLDRILSLASAPRATEAHPLFQAAINYRTAGGGGIDIWDLPLGADDTRMELSWHGAKEAENPYDVSLGFFEMPGGGCLAQIWCSATLYGPEACQSLMDVYLRLLEAVARDPEVTVDQFSLYDDTDPSVLRALEVGRGPEVKFDWVETGSSLCLSRRVRDMCRLHPERTAVTDAVGSVSYAQLADRTSHLAHQLKEAGVRSRHVAVLCEPSIDGIVTMLAILEVGAVYVPLDVSLPASRHADMLRLCEPALVLFHSQTDKRINALVDDVVGEQQMRVLRVDVDHIQDDPNAHGDLDDSNKISSAFLLFTSGSTGIPNGVHLTQPNFANHIALKAQTFSLTHTDCVLQQSSLGFDMALVQTFSALANGGRLVIAPADSRRDPVAIAALLKREAISMTIATPTEYLAWIHAAADVLANGNDDDKTAWRLAFSGGEQIPPRLLTELGRLGIPGLRLTNCYGPTEITAAATFQPIPLDNGNDPLSASCVASLSAPSAIWRPFAVGKALPNYTVIIVDPITTSTTPQPLPLGQTGEICIGGAGVALGYLNRPDLTHLRFLTNVPGMGKSTVYRTGDKGRLLSDGTLLCLGRLDGDTQIKLRGQRVDLQEIEAAVLRASAGVLASVVVSRRRLDGADAGGVGEDDILVAHATLAEDKDRAIEQDDSDTSSISSILSHVRLPQAFIPAAIYTLKTLPTTPNGKLDRRAIARLLLPERMRLNPLGSDLNAINTNATEQNEGEKLTVRQGELRLLWERVLPSLGEKRIGPSSDFFLCGGNSLLLMKLQKAIKETTGVETSTKQMYEATTLRAMTRAVFEDSAAAEENARIDWNTETAVPGWLREEIETIGATVASASAAAVEKDKTEAGIEVLLTGASSFPGSHILTALLNHPSVRKVHCIAVPSDHHQPLSSPSSASIAEVVYYTGTLLSKTLGLTSTEREHLSQTVHIIVHAAAHGHCLNRFATLRRPNLESLHSLASLSLASASPRKTAIPILYLSSPRTLLLAGKTETPRAPSSLRDFPPPAVDGSDGYTASKWAGEVFLENLVNHLKERDHGTEVGARGPPGPNPLNLKIAIHRSCTLVSLQAPNSDAMNGILRYSLAMRCVPRLRRAEGFLDFAPLDDVVEQIAAAAVELAALPDTSISTTEAPAANSSQSASSSVRFRHHSGGIKTPFSQFRTHMETVYGGAFDEVDMQEWLVRASRQGLDPLITAYIEALLESGMPLVSPYLGADLE
ncbi:uncharacterized protein BDZ83DRAFT_616985 [Colletotrichum acutatum]|uniref:Polyketide synthase n=1 Tax=Glomerella acutata TaxID=27357 RepID=A0AAD8XFW0_GLOAC|nr:uncharacterized protein BDZ83DRAFT_616985 [Colletotrichum acutatum]KAK1726269.1 hypothetical protein BDZ83DRAFT_616985 [Colletotrichum acutatum]